MEFCAILYDALSFHHIHFHHVPVHHGRHALEETVEEVAWLRGDWEMLREFFLRTNERVQKPESRESSVRGGEYPPLSANFFPSAMGGGTPLSVPFFAKFSRRLADGRMDGGIPRGPHEPKKIPQQLLHFYTQCVILHLVCNFTLSVTSECNSTL